ncbi:hypothetical protein TVAG_105800 [Trichomonas vaginalis G3]|uniref:Protein prenyltransferase alpha subunit repeat containing protein n=1 Tax=Trichomonas vaginalis (strain ATCC PRA-98 / G3) TaxID=412133 RepID=A2FLR9_TRIV3|nr:protein prenylyltransferase family [Trichomonas vaginalis G3]EAX94161.1 hypothetical protein TVAG_105800 [Trichomonas vaginalis G3]KAI5518072.1 protein prenylyltransferase family [Trichomonas vaginalis G3]|eukprot:XP_001307091.1 hypothetical protein [Trichomonas vaginalis G3]
MNLNDFIDNALKVKSIEAVSDFYIQDSSGIVVSGDEMAISKTLLKELTRFSIVNIDSDADKASLIGVLIGSHDERPFIYRRKFNNQNIEEELHFCQIGLTVNPKCQGAFTRIRELLLINKNQSQITKHIEFCNFLTTKRERNYLLWSHRVWLYDTFSLETDEISWVSNWTKCHPSDSSAFAYYQHIMPKDTEFLQKELKQNTINLFEFPGHESLWSFRKFLLQSLSKSISVPSGWKHINNIHEDLILPEQLFGSQITDAYIELAQKFAVKLSLIPVEYDIPEKSEFNLLNENLIVQIALSDDYPTEFQAQQTAAKRYFRWIHAML